MCLVCRKDPTRQCYHQTNEPFLGDQSCKEKKASSQSARVPEIMQLELQPRTNAALQRMSDISHNPHLRVKVKCDQTISSVIDMIEKKWVPASYRYVSFLTGYLAGIRLLREFHV